MKTFVLPAAIDPDVVIFEGKTFCSYQDIARGTVVESWTTDPNVRTLEYHDPAGTGCGRLTVARQTILFAYRRNEGARAVPVPADVKASLDMGATLGNQPIAWNITERPFLAIQRPPGCRVQYGEYPAMATEDIGQGAPTGLSLVEGVDAVAWTMDDMRNIRHLDDPCVLATQDYVSQGHDGGIQCQFLGAQGVLFPGHETFQPRVALAFNGTYTVVYGQRDGRGALPLIVCTGVTSADFAPPTPVDPPVDPPVEPPIDPPVDPPDPPDPVDPTLPEVPQMPVETFDQALERLATHVFGLKEWPVAQAKQMVRIVHDCLGYIPVSPYQAIEGVQVALTDTDPTYPNCRAWAATQPRP